MQSFWTFMTITSNRKKIIKVVWHHPLQNQSSRWNPTLLASTITTSTMMQHPQQICGWKSSWWNITWSSGNLIMCILLMWLAVVMGAWWDHLKHLRKDSTNRNKKMWDLEEVFINSYWWINFNCFFNLITMKSIIISIFKVLPM